MTVGKGRHEGSGDRRRRQPREVAGHRPDRGAQVRIRLEHVAGANGRRRQEARRGLGLRRRVAIGYPGVVVRDQPATEPHNLAPGWVDFDYPGAFGCPVRIINDAALQALGQLSLRQAAVPRPRNGARNDAHRRRRGGADGARTSALPPRAASRTTSARPRANATARRSGANALSMSSKRSRAAFVADDVVIGGGNVRHLETAAPKAAAPATTRMRSRVGFACGHRRRARRECLQPSQRRRAGAP